MLFPRYVWIAFAGDYGTLVAGSTCSREQVGMFLDGVFTLLPVWSNAPENNSVFAEVLQVCIFIIQ